MYTRQVYLGEGGLESFSVVFRMFAFSMDEQTNAWCIGVLLSLINNCVFLGQCS